MMDRRRPTTFWETWGPTLVQVVMWALGLFGTAVYGIHQLDKRRDTDMFQLNLRLQRIEIAIGLDPLPIYVRPAAPPDTGSAAGQR